MQAKTLKIQQQGISTDFCDNCGELIDLQTFFSEITCHRCNSVYSMEEFVGKPLRTKIIIREGKEWLEKYKNLNYANKSRGSRHKSTTKEHCPKCNHNELWFYTAQTRSADEGSTVFYECTKCNYAFTHNN